MERGTGQVWGLSEQTDSVTIIVSEETGQVSVAQGGKLTRGVKTVQNSEKSWSERRISRL